jgi:hypothetical protein
LFFFRGCLGLLGRLVRERDCAGSTWVVVVIRPSLSCALRLPSLWLVLLIAKVTETRMSKINVGYSTQLLLFEEVFLESLEVVMAWL